MRHFCDSIYTVNASDECFSVTAYTMDANEAQEEYEEVQTELRKKEEEVSRLLGLMVKIQDGTKEIRHSISLHILTHTKA